MLWRIATEASTYTALDLSGKGAEKTGGRWNRPQTAMVYTSTSIALACLETVVHLDNRMSLPLNRYLVEITVPSADWAEREQFDPSRHGGWDSEPAGMTSMDFGTDWAKTNRSLLLEVPSVVVPEECNVLINPAHASMSRIKVGVKRKWIYDGRLA